MALTFEEWAPLQPGGGSYAEYEAYVNASGGGSSVSGESGGAAGSKVLNLNSGTPYQRPAGIPAYNGYQAPDYAATTPNTTHWLNTMNAFAPTARTDMERLLGQGGNGAGRAVMAPVTYDTVHIGEGAPGYMDAFYPATQPIDGTQPQQPDAVFAKSTGLLGQPKPALSAEDYITPSNPTGTGLLGGPTQATQPTNPFPSEWTQNSAPGYMDAFWNVPGSAYAPPGSQAQQQTASSQPANTQQSNSWSNGTVGINPATGSLMFL